MDTEKAEKKVSAGLGVSEVIEVIVCKRSPLSS